MFTMTTHQTVPSPESAPYMNSPIAFVQPLHRDKGSYVQRWKVLRERNRNLPKLDFNVNTFACKRPQRYPGIGIARSLTLESMKLPSIPTSSIITTATHGTTGGSSIKTTGSGSKKVTVQETDKRDRETQLNAALSRSLPNIANNVQQESKNSSTITTKHRFEKIAHTKKLSRRSEDKETSQQHLEQSGIFQFNLCNLQEVDESTPNVKANERKIAPRENSNAFNERKFALRENPNVLNNGRTRQKLDKDQIGRISRRKKWRESCKCMRCEMMKRQFQEGDAHYTKWGIYPCQNTKRNKYYEQYFYDSD